MAIDPLTLALNVINKEGKRQGRNLEEAKSKAKNQVANIGNLLGTSLYAGANNPDDVPDPKTGAIGGAITGASTGMNAGPLGMLGGALLGGLTGYITTGFNRADYEESEYENTESMLLGETIQPDVMYAEEGGEMYTFGDAELAPVQMEKGEMILYGDLSLVESKSDKTHEDMDESDVTDIMPKESFSFSNSDKYTLNKDEIDDDVDVLGYMPVEYSDSNKTSLKETDKVRFSDIMSDDEMTFAEIAKDIKKKFKTSDRENDSLTEMTNDANRESRLPYLQKAIYFQERKTGRISPTGEPTGEGTNEGKPKVPKFQTGGPGFLAFLQGNVRGATEAAKNSQNLEDAGNAFNAALLETLRDYGWGVTPSGRIVDQDNNEVDTTEVRSAVEDKFGRFQAREQDFKDAFREISGKLSANRKFNKENRDLQIDRLKRLSGTLRGRAGRGLASQAIFTGMQSSRVNPGTTTPGDLQARVQDVPYSVQESQIGDIYDNVYRTTASVLDQGASTTRSANVLASAVSRAEKVASDVRADFSRAEAINRAKRAEIRQRVIDANREKIADAENRETDNVNTKLANIGSAYNEYLTNLNRLDTNVYGAENAIEREYNTNRQTNLQSEVDLLGNELSLGAQQDYIDLQRDYINESEKRRQQRASEGGEDRVISPLDLGGYRDVLEQTSPRLIDPSIPEFEVPSITNPPNRKTPEIMINVPLDEDVEELRNDLIDDREDRLPHYRGGYNRG